jgi:hypothetical protein
MGKHYLQQQPYIEASLPVALLAVRDNIYISHFQQEQHLLQQQRTVPLTAGETCTI